MFKNNLFTHLSDTGSSDISIVSFKVFAKSLERIKFFKESVHLTPL